VGSVQDSDNKTHTHVMAAGRNGASLNNNQQFPTTTLPLGGDALTQATGNSAEARPQNANVEYIIKV
jgi:hypothetical protein